MTGQEQDREALARVIAPHRQNHHPATGASYCSCQGWEGPYTLMDGPRSFSAHLAEVASDWLAEVVRQAKQEVVRDVADWADSNYVWRQDPERVRSMLAAVLARHARTDRPALDDRCVSSGCRSPRCPDHGNENTARHVGADQ